MPSHRRADDRLQATGVELGDSIFNMTGEGWFKCDSLQ